MVESDGTAADGLHVHWEAVSGVIPRVVPS